ncbi:hypothetical protein BH11MYX3_BH11MYX3_16310 [soil metagenome]
MRSIVRGWWSDHGLADHPATVGKRIALALLERKTIEDKLAAIIVLGELLGEQLRASDLPGFARLFVRRHLEDDVIVDAFSTRVLGTLLEREAGRDEVIRSLAQWRTAETIWQRRAACVAFARLAPLGDAVPTLTDAILVLCASVVWSHEPFDQSGVALVLRELSRAEPVCVEAFIRRYARLMSKACARQAVSKLPAALRAELMADHRRATTIRR